MYVYVYNLYIYIYIREYIIIHIYIYGTIWYDCIAHPKLKMEKWMQSGQPSPAASSTTIPTTYHDSILVILWMVTKACTSCRWLISLSLSHYLQCFIRIPIVIRKTAGFLTSSSSFPTLFHHHFLPTKTLAPWQRPSGGLWVRTKDLAHECNPWSPRQGAKKRLAPSEARLGNP